MRILEIHSNRSQLFNDYIIKKIKADLKQSALSFNSVFLYHGKEYTLLYCIDSLFCKNGLITFRELLPIKHLIYNNRQLFWIDVMNFYARNLASEYLIWKGKYANKKTFSRRIK